MRTSLWALCGVVLVATTARADVPIDDFEDVSDWVGLSAEHTVVRRGQGAGRWSHHETQPRIRKDFSPPLDVSGETSLRLWLYSAVANGADVQLVFDSEDPDDAEGWDYFSTTLHVDWAGWRFVRVPLERFGASRHPLGWNHINYVSLNANGWNHTPQPDTDLVLDEMSFGRGVVAQVRPHTRWVGGDFEVTFDVDLSEQTGVTRQVSLSFDLPATFPFTTTLEHATVTLPAGATVTTWARFTLPAGARAGLAALTPFAGTLLVEEGGVTIDAVALPTAAPLDPRPAPRTLLDADDFTRIADWADQRPWAQVARDAIVTRAQSWPQAWESAWGVTGLALPPEGGQWSGWYVCPTHGAQLTYLGPDRHQCPIDGHVFDEHRFQQVIYGRMHNQLATWARDLALAWRLGGDASSCAQAAAILGAYADAYAGYPLHDKDGGGANSGGRVLAQTLDEAVWLISMAWAFDLTDGCPGFSAAARAHVEQGLLRPAVDVIRRNGAGVSNWQSWHNAAIAAVGFAVDEPTLIAAAIDDPQQGLRFQMANSVTADGFWYEGSWSYHFYALDPLMQLAQMGRRAGVDLFAEPALQSMFRAPVAFAMPDGTLPPFNDASATSLTASARFFEAAWETYRDPLYLGVLGRGARGRDALFWGAADVTPVASAPPPSVLFEDAGYAVLRAGDAWLGLDFGPHGGWHGHFDKLGFVYAARGATLAIDPGTQSYAAPTHTTWDKVTVAHNTVVVDERSQAEATGAWHRFVGLSGLAAAAASAGPVYGAAPEPHVELLRTMVLTPEYVVDRFRVTASDGAPHDVDWVLHAPGVASTTLPVTPWAGFPAADGYQHLKQTKAAATPGGWEVRFDDVPDAGPFGSAWASAASVTASFTHSLEQAHGGDWAGKLAWDFSAQTGYALYSTPAPALTGVPRRVALWVYGDGSGHRLQLRLNDASDERFITPLGLVDWTGWRRFEVSGVEGWQHNLGNNDGVFDAPARGVTLELSYQAGGPSAGALYVDDIEVEGAPAELVHTFDFELPRGSLRLWMLGEAGTTAVTGEGLGPNLQVPVPFAMARRRSADTTFLSLFEPYGDAPVITAFEAVDTDASKDDDAVAWHAAAPGFDDLGLLAARGAAGTTRTFGAATCDGTTCFIRRVEGALARLVLAEGTRLSAEVTLASSEAPVTLQVDYAGERLVVESAAPLWTPLRLYAPGVTEVTVNDGAVAFTREGDDVIVGAAPGDTDGGPLTPDAGPGVADAGVSDAPNPGGEAVEGNACGCAGAPWGTGALGAWLLVGLRRRRRLGTRA